MTIARPLRSTSLIPHHQHQSITWFDQVSRWHRNHRTRLQLGNLSCDVLRDVGLTEADRDLEMKKWFWQA